MNKSIIYTSLIRGDFTLHSGQKSKYLFDVMKLIKNPDFLLDFHEFTKGDFLVGIELGGAILAAIDGGYVKDFAIIRKDGTIYGSPIPKKYVLLDDVITTENSVRMASKQLVEQLGGIGHHPDEIKCIVDRRKKENRALHIESMLECNE